MSWRHVQAAGLIPLKRPPAKAVLLSLGHHANDFTGRCWPSIERLAVFTGLAKRSVQTAVKELEKAGYVTIERGGGKTSSVYTLHLPECEPISQGGVQELHRGVQEVHPRGAGAAPKSSMNDERNDARAATAPLPSGWWPDEEALSWAHSNFTTVDVEAETQLFVDSAAKKGEHYADPVAAWKVWIRRGEQFAVRDQKREQSRNAPRARNGGGAASLRQAAAAARGQRPRR